MIDSLSAMACAVLRQGDPAAKVQAGAAYGDLPAHDGLWQAATDAAGDDQSAAILQVILDEEIGHVAAGLPWFEWSCRRQGLAPVGQWRQLVDEYFKEHLKPPFNHGAGKQAGMERKYYQPDA